MEQKNLSGNCQLLVLCTSIFDNKEMRNFDSLIKKNCFFNKVEYYTNNGFKIRKAIVISKKEFDNNNTPFELKQSFSLIMPYLCEVEQDIKEAVELWNVPQQKRQELFNMAILRLKGCGYKTAISGAYIQSLWAEYSIKRSEKISFLLRNSDVLNQDVIGFNLVLNPENPEINLLHNGCFRFK